MPLISLGGLLPIAIVLLPAFKRLRKHASSFKSWRPNQMFRKNSNLPIATSVEGLKNFVRVLAGIFWALMMMFTAIFDTGSLDEAYDALFTWFCFLLFVEGTLRITCVLFNRPSSVQAQAQAAVYLPPRPYLSIMFWVPVLLLVRQIMHRMPQLLNELLKELIKLVPGLH
jgi:hypothetical protein